MTLTKKTYHSWDDWDEPALREPTMCLFDENVFPSASLAYAHMKSNHGFDLTAVRKKLRKLGFPLN